MKLIAVFFCICVAWAVAEVEPVCAKGKSVTRVEGTSKQICRGDLIFEDNFDFLDMQKWQHENTLAGGGNWEFQWYTNNRQNSWARNGELVIKPTLTADDIGYEALTSATLDINGGSPADACTNPAFYGCIRAGTPTNVLNPAKSARLRTLENFAFTYGKVEITAKMPAGDWLWPAIWMMPKYNKYGAWPASGEIDIMEGRGNKNFVENGVNIGTQQMGSTLHWGPDYFHNQYPRTHWQRQNAAGYDTDFHVYGIDWAPDYISFSLDGDETGSVAPPAGGFWELGELGGDGVYNPWIDGSKMAPFDDHFYIIINLAVGGIAYFPDGASNPGGKPWSNTSPQAATDFWNGREQWIPTWNGPDDADTVKVDSVRVWAL